jgi:hypothetical protein
MSPYAAIDMQVRGLLGNLCQHLYMDNLHFPFKAILLYCDIHFIGKQFAALTAKTTSTKRKELWTIYTSKDEQKP